MEEWVASRPIARYLVRQPVGAEQDVDVVPGLRHDMVQSFDLVVSQARSTQLYTVVLATTPALSEHDRGVITRALLATRRPEVVFLLEATPDSAAAQCAEGVSPSATAAAVGVVVRSFGQPNSVPVSVSVTVNGQRWSVRAELEGQRWRCQALPE